MHGADFFEWKDALVESLHDASRFASRGEMDHRSETIVDDREDRGVGRSANVVEDPIEPLQID